MKSQTQTHTRKPRLNVMEALRERYKSLDLPKDQVCKWEKNNEIPKTSFFPLLSHVRMSFFLLHANSGEKKVTSHLLLEHHN